MIHDLRHALRQLARSPGFTAVVVLTLGLGTGACVAIFSVVDGVLLRSLPYPQSDGLVVLRETHQPAFPGSFVRPDTYRDWRKQATSFESLAFVRDGSYNLTGTGVPVPVYVGRTTANTFSTLRVGPAMGRDFFAEEDVPGKGRVVVLSHGFWQRQFGGRPEVLHQTIQLDGQPFTVVGVMPKTFHLDRPFDIFTPGYVPRKDESANQFLEVIGRLKAGVTVEYARREMSLLAAGLAKQDPRRYRDWGVMLAPMLESRVAEVRPALLALLGAVGFLLLIACANVANLLLARATGRARELAVRVALGASRSRIVRQLLTESLVLALVGGLLGVLLAKGGLTALLAVAPDSLPRAQEIVVDARLLLFTCALALVTGMGFGLAPAFAATRVSLHDTLKESGRGSTQGRHRQRLRGGLVMGQVAIALVLLVGAGLLIRSFARLQDVNRGFTPEGALAVRLALPEEKYATPSERASFAQQAITHLAALPGVKAVGAVQRLPFAGSLMFIHIKAAGRPEPPDRPAVNWYSVSPDYFKAMGIPVLRGRVFDGRDVAGTDLVTIISQSVARAYFGDANPIGKRISAVHRPGAGAEIVGVVGDLRDESLAGGLALQVYGSFAQDPYLSLTFVLSTAGVAPGLAAVRAAIQSVDRNQSVSALRPLTDLVAQSIARQRFAMLLFAVFSGAALGLAAIGIYGVMAYSVAQRTGELGIRRALGAQTGDVLRLVLREGGRLLAAGLAAGLVGALLVTRLLASMLFGVGSHDPVTFAAVAALVSLVAAAACLLPALRATRVSPMTALRSE